MVISVGYLEDPLLHLFLLAIVILAIIVLAVRQKRLGKLVRSASSVNTSTLTHPPSEYLILEIDDPDDGELFYTPVSSPRSLQRLEMSSSIQSITSDAPVSTILEMEQQLDMCFIG